MAPHVQLSKNRQSEEKVKKVKMKDGGMDRRNRFGGECIWQQKLPYSGLFLKSFTSSYSRNTRGQTM